VEGSSGVAAQRVAVTAHRRDADTRPGFGEAAAQVMDMHVERVRADFLVEPVKTRQQHLAMDRRTGPPQQRLEQGSFARPQGDRAAIDDRLPIVLVELDIGESEVFWTAWRAPPGDGANPRHQLIEIEGFDEIIVGAPVEQTD